MSDPIPPVEYALAGRHHIAYQVLGDGPFDLVYSPFWFSHLDVCWDTPEVASASAGSRRSAD